jgi:putative membrane protein
MKKNIVSALVLATATSLAACGGGMQGQQGGMQQGGTASMGDAEIAAVLDAANRAEIQQAELARERAEAEEVRQYATALLSGHQSAVERQDMILQERGIPTRDNPMSQQLEQQAMQVQQELANLDGEQFDRAFLEAQMRQHQQLISMLEQQLIPAAQDPQYRAYLEQQLGSLQAHLRNAQRLQQQVAAAF